MPPSFETVADIQRLAARDPAFAVARAELVEGLAIREDALVLEAGCGCLPAAEEMLERSQHTRLLGIDIEASLLTRLEASEGSARRILRCAGDAARLPLLDHTVDVVLADKLLLHVASPLAVLAEMKRVVRPGGRLGAFEWDMVGVSVTCDVPGFNRAFARTQAVTSISPDAPYCLHEWFDRLGLEDIQVSLWPLTSKQLSETWSRFLQADFDAAFACGIVDKTTTDSWWADIREKNRRGTFRAATIATVAWGRVAN